MPWLAALIPAMGAAGGAGAAAAGTAAAGTAAAGAGALGAGTAAGLGAAGTGVTAAGLGSGAIGTGLTGAGLAAAPTIGGAAGGGMMSSILPSAIGSMMSTMGNSQQGIPALLAGAAQNLPGSVPQIGPDLASAVPGMLQDPTHLFPDVTLLQPPGMAGPGPAATPPGVPPIPPTPAWKQALSASAQVQDMMMKGQNNRPANAPAPHFYIPQGVKPPSFGAPLAKGPSPLEKYALMLRRM